MPNAALLAELGIGRLFDLVPDAVVIGDVASGLVVAWNAAAEETFGYAEAEAIGMPLSELVPPELRDAHVTGLARYGAGGGGDLIGSRRLIELPALRADGGRIWVELRLAAVTPESGDPRRYALAVFRDVTSKHLAQDEAVAALTAAEAANVALQDFVAMIAHDLRTPLAGVSLAVDLLARRWDDLTESARLETMAMARRQVTFSVSLLDDLIDLSQLQAGRLSVAAAQVELLPILVSAVETSGVAATVDAAPDLQVFADPGHVQRCVVNLLVNAMKYGAAPITVAADSRAGSVSVQVDDSGAGLPPELADRVFEKFVRGADTAGNQAGAGLGLAIVAGLVAANRGSVSHAVAPSGGARFTLTWPAAAPLAASPAPSPRPSS